MKRETDCPIKILTASELGIKGLELFGHACFRETHNMLMPHRHSSVEFIVMLKGSQRYEVGGHTFTIHGGDIFMTYPGEVHSGGNAPQEVAEIIWFQLSFSDADQFLGTVYPHSVYLFEQLQQYNHRILRVSQKELQVLARSFDLCSGKSVKERVLGHNYLLNFILRNLCGTENSASDVSASGFDFLAVKNYMKEHINDNPSLEELAAYCGFSPSKFSNHFKEAVGTTPHAYMLKLKLERAKDLLRGTDKTIMEIAQELAFSSSDYFSSVFKKYTGMTPTQYRL